LREEISKIRRRNPHSRLDYKHWSPEYGVDFQLLGDYLRGKRPWNLSANYDRLYFGPMHVPALGYLKM
jgi:hypothetical protein